MLRNYSIGKGYPGASKAPIALYSSRTPEGSASASIPPSTIGIGQDK